MSNENIKRIKLELKDMKEQITYLCDADKETAGYIMEGIDKINDVLRDIATEKTTNKLKRKLKAIETTEKLKPKEEQIEQEEEDADEKKSKKIV